MTLERSTIFGVNPLAPQIEKAVGEPHLLGVFGVGVDRQRQRLGGRLHDQLADHHLDFAGRDLRVHRVGRARTTLPVTVMTLSSRSASAAANSGDDTSITHCVTP